MNDTDPASLPADDAAPELLARYVSGTATPEEQRAVDSRLASDSGYRREYERLLLIWERAGTALDASLSEVDSERAWSRLATALNQAGTSAPTRAQPGVYGAGSGRPLRPGLLWLGRRARAAPWTGALIAACMALVLALGVWSLDPREAAREATASYHQVISGPGQRLRVKLADGSNVVLAPGTRLRTPTSAGVDREVFLEGRAYFEVATDSARPFLVHAAGAVVRVLGTEFDVRAYPGAVETEIAVRSGRVAVRPASAGGAREQVLVGGDLGIVAAGTVQVESGVDVESLVSWVDGTLSFRGTPLHEAVPELERWFDVQLELSDAALGRRRITATFRGEPLDVVLRAIAELVDARVERSRERIILSPLR